MQALKQFAEASGWHVEPGASIPYGEQVVVRHDGQRAVANFWPKRGTLTIQGPDSPLVDELKAWQSDLSADKTGGGKPSLGLPHIGIDESGKGDWFGPLVVAAVELDTRTTELLRLLVVRDSKRLGPATLVELASQIERVVDDAHRHVLVVARRELNREHVSRGNIAAVETVAIPFNPGQVLCRHGPGQRQLVSMQVDEGGPKPPPAPERRRRGLGAGGSAGSPWPEQ
jgi:ribonuclease HIII